MNNKNLSRAVLATLVTANVVFAEGTVDVEAKQQQINVIQNQVAVVVDGKVLAKDNIIYNNTTYLPVRAVSESLGLKVNYDGTNKRVDISQGGMVKMETITNRKNAVKQSWNADINGLQVYTNDALINADNIVFNGVTYLPLRAVGEATNVDVDYNSNTKTVYLYTNTYGGEHTQIEVPKASNTVNVGSPDPNNLLDGIFGGTAANSGGSGSVVVDMDKLQ